MHFNSWRHASTIDTIEFLARLKSAAFPGVAPEALPDKFEVTQYLDITQLDIPRQARL